MFKCEFCGYIQEELMTECPECLRSKIAEVEADAKIEAPKSKAKRETRGTIGK